MCALIRTETKAREGRGGTAFKRLDEKREAREATTDCSGPYLNPHAVLPAMMRPLRAQTVRGSLGSFASAHASSALPAALTRVVLPTGEVIGRISKTQATRLFYFSQAATSRIQFWQLDKDAF